MPRRETTIRLTWQQVTWALAVLVGILGAWADLKRDVAVTRTTVELSTAALAGRVEKLEQRKR